MEGSGRQADHFAEDQESGGKESCAGVPGPCVGQTVKKREGSFPKIPDIPLEIGWEDSVQVDQMEDAQGVESVCLGNCVCKTAPGSGDGVSARWEGRREGGRERGKEGEREGERRRRQREEGRAMNPRLVRMSRQL